jgi:hypothetical protein
MSPLKTAERHVMASDEAANFVLERGRVVYLELQKAKAEIERLQQVIKDRDGEIAYLKSED